MEFEKYQHIERLGTTTVKNIDNGLCYIFPKIDGTNSSLWVNDDGELQAGSRNRHLSLDNDNACFLDWATKQKNIKEFFDVNPTLRLYGEWLVPHTLRTYRDDAWRNFYVFDVTHRDCYINYESYSELLGMYNISYITPICIIENPSHEKLMHCLSENTFLIKNGEGIGEGIVIKRYDFVNRHGDMKWAKIVANEFYEQKECRVKKIENKNDIEIRIVNQFVTASLVEKEYSKIEVECGWESKMIPRLLNTVFYCLITEESWNFIKKFKNPTIDYKRLINFTFAKVKEIKHDLFR